MHVVTGSTGHVGSSVIKTLVSRGEKVLAVTHSATSMPALKLAGAEVALVDLCDTKALTSAFSRGSTLFLINPPGPVSEDASSVEKKTIACLLEALAASSIVRVVAESTQGAQPGEQIGDLGTLYELEKVLRAVGRPARITRAGYYFSNWETQAKSVQATGVLKSFFPADFNRWWRRKI